MTIVTVEDYGAVGDGTTLDTAACLAMAAATGGTIRFLEKHYNVGSLAIEGFDDVQIIGARKPNCNAAGTALENGTRLTGTVNVRCYDFFAKKWGSDNGSGVVAVGSGAGMFINAPETQRGRYAVVHDVSVLGNNLTDQSHGMGIQGFDNVETNNLWFGKLFLGLVNKSRRGFIRNTRCWNVVDTGVFIKSDIAASNANVLDGTADQCIVDGVYYEAPPGNVDFDGVQVAASSCPVYNTIVRNVKGKGGQSAVHVYGAGPGNIVFMVDVDGVQAAGSLYGVLLEGGIYNPMISKVMALDVTSGEAIHCISPVVDGHARDLQIIVGNSAITSAVCATFLGSWIWDGITVRNGYRNMSVVADPGVVGGLRRGNIA